MSERNKWLFEVAKCYSDLLIMYCRNTLGLQHFSLSLDGIVVIIFDGKRQFTNFIKQGKKNDIIPKDNDKYLNLPISSFVFMYKLQKLVDVSYEKRCHVCGSTYIKDQLCAEYYLYKVIYSGEDVTNEFEAGGKYSESVIGLTATLKKINDKYKAEQGKKDDMDMMVL